MHYSEKSIEEQANFFYVFSILTASGVPILEAMETASGIIFNKILKKVMSEIRGMSKEGERIAPSFSKYPDIFPPIIIGMIRTGEESGNLDIVLREISEIIETKYKFLENPTQLFEEMVFFINFNILIQSGMPIEYIWDIASDGIQDKILKNALKQIKGNVKNGSKVSDAFSKYPNIFPPIIIGMIRTGEELEDLDICLSKISNLLETKYKFLESPTQSFEEMIFFFNSSILVGAGVPYVQVLEIIDEAIQNKILKAAVRQIKKDVENGMKIADAFLKQDIFPEFVAPLIKAGEIGGILDVMLKRIVTIYERRLEFD